MGSLYLVSDPLTKLKVLGKNENKYVVKRDGIGPGLSGSGSYLEPSEHLVLQGLLAGGWAEPLEAEVTAYNNGVPYKEKKVFNAGFNYAADAHELLGNLKSPVPVEPPKSPLVQPKPVASTPAKVVSQQPATKISAEPITTGNVPTLVSDKISAKGGSPEDQEALRIINGNNWDILNTPRAQKVLEQALRRGDIISIQGGWDLVSSHHSLGLRVNPYDRKIALDYVSQGAKFKFIGSLGGKSMMQPGSRNYFDFKAQPLTFAIGKIGDMAYWNKGLSETDDIVSLPLVGVYHSWGKNTKEGTAYISAIELEKDAVLNYWNKIDADHTTKDGFNASDFLLNYQSGSWHPKDTEPNIIRERN